MIYLIVAVMPLQFNLFTLQQISQLVAGGSTITQQYRLRCNMGSECMDYIISGRLAPVDTYCTDMVISVSCYTNAELFVR